jgi:hypothetical protein
MSSMKKKLNWQNARARRSFRLAHVRPTAPRPRLASADGMPMSWPCGDAACCEDRACRSVVWRMSTHACARGRTRARARPRHLSPSHTHLSPSHPIPQHNSAAAALLPPPPPPRGFAATTPAARARGPSPPGSTPPSAAETGAYLSSVGVPGSIVSALQANHADCLAHGLEAVIKPKVGLLLKDVVGGDGAALGAVLAAVPRVLNAALETGLGKTVAFLQSPEPAGLGLRPSTLKRLAVSRPQVLTYDVDKTLAPKAAFFTKELGIPPAGLRRMVSRSPDVLVIGLGNDLKPTVAWLESLGFTRGSQELINLLVDHPTIFHNPLETAKKNVRALGEWGVDGPGVRALLSASPSLFRRSVTSPSNLAKLAYWEAAVQRPRAAIARDAPNLFERSLAKCIGPRLDTIAVRKGALPPDLRPLLDGTDAAWGASHGVPPPVEGWARKNAGKYTAAKAAKAA